MKLLFGLLLLFFAGFFHQNPAATSSLNDDPKVVIEIQYVNGEKSTVAYSPETYLKLKSLLPEGRKESEVGWCTAMFSNSDVCMTTRPTCAEAQAEFNACACKKGYTRLCPQD